MRRVTLDGHEGELFDYESEVLVARVGRAFAPGAPIALQLEGMTLEAKSQGSRKQEDGRFEVRMRLVNLRREQRARLEALRSA